MQTMEVDRLHIHHLHPIQAQIQTLIPQTPTPPNQVTPQTPTPPNQVTPQTPTPNQVPPPPHTLNQVPPPPLTPPPPHTPNQVLLQAHTPNQVPPQIPIPNQLIHTLPHHHLIQVPQVHTADLHRLEKIKCTCNIYDNSSINI